MKIAIVTVYDSIVNFGSFLQAYSLQEVLKKEGHEVAFVKRMDKSELLERFNGIAYRNSGVGDTKFWDILRKIKRYKRYKRACEVNQKRYDSFIPDLSLIKIIDISEAEFYDCIICGSDEIWNKDNKDIDMGFYTCGDIGNPEKYSYAISSGEMEQAALNDAEISNINKFKYNLCRDEKTLSLLRNIGANTDTEIVCDPTILYGRDNFPVYKQKNSKYKLPEKYMLVYSYVYTKNQKTAIKDYARMNGMKIVSASLDADFADMVVLASALDFPYLIANAECVYAATFHGAIFGMMFAKKLAIMPRMHKISSVVNACGGQEYLVNENFSIENLCEVLEKNVNHDSIESNMSKIREKSHDLLVDMLKNVKV